MSRYLDKSQKVSTKLEDLDSLDLSQQSRQKSRTAKANDGHSQRFSKVGLDRSRNFDLHLDWS
jgi:hypothetical protein